MPHPPRKDGTPRREFVKPKIPHNVDLRIAKGFHFLLRYFNGESITRIAQSAHHDPRRIRDLMKTAASTLIDQAQSTLLADVFPKMVELLKASIEQQLQAAKDGKSVDTALVERLMKGLFITDAPQLRSQLVQEVGGQEEGAGEMTLAGFVAKKVLAPARPQTNALPSPSVIEGQTVTVDNGNTD